MRSLSALWPKQTSLRQRDGMKTKKVGLGVEFLAVVESAIHRAALMPLVYQCIRRRPDVRRILTKRFPYRIFFILRPDAIIIFRVLHNARDEREWKNAVDG